MKRKPFRDEPLLKGTPKSFKNDLKILSLINPAFEGNPQKLSK